MIANNELVWGWIPPLKGPTGLHWSCLHRRMFPAMMKLFCEQQMENIWSLQRLKIIWSIAAERDNLGILHNNISWKCQVLLPNEFFVMRHILSSSPPGTWSMTSYLIKEILIKTSEDIHCLLPCVVGDILDEESSWSLARLDTRQLYSEVRDIFVGVDIPAQRHAGVIPDTRKE